MKFNFGSPFFLTIILAMLGMSTALQAQLVESYIKLDWKPLQAEKIQGSDDKLTFLNFEGAGYNEWMLPVWQKRFDDFGDKNVVASITNALYEPVPKGVIIPDGAVREAVSVQTNLAMEQKRAYCEVQIVPFRKNVTTGIIERLLSFTLSLSSDGTRQRTGSNLQQAAAASSVLANGNWYKIATLQNGIHKLSYQQLKSLGMDVDNLDPRNLRMYGNGGGMLPQANAVLRYDDLQENAIYVEGAQDGVFNSTDYVLFFGESQNQWRYKPANTCLNFEHQINLYADSTYFFITSDLGVGKRIAQQASSTLAPTVVVNSFDDFKYHEVDQVNLIKSGREWYGEQFDVINSTRNIAFEFPNLITSEQVKINVSVAGRSISAINSWQVSANGQPVTTFNVNTVPGPPIYYLDYANNGGSCSGVLINGSTLNVGINFSSADQAASGWLNFIEINARRALAQTSLNGQTIFRDSRSVGLGTIAQYEIGSVVTNALLWEITDPLNIKSQQYVLNGNTATFVQSTDSLRTYVISGNNYLNPYLSGKVNNQDLHGLAQTDMIIISHPAFMASAEELATLHRTKDGLSVAVVTPEQVYNEFSSGAQDVTAIRDFMKMFYDRSTPGNIYPKYLLLHGDCSYDPKDRITNNTNFVIAYESQNSTNLSNSYTSDDFFGQLDVNEGEWLPSATEVVDIAIGRHPVKTVDEANGVVNKIKVYSATENINTSDPNCTVSSTSPFGDWRNVFTYVADDEDGNTHLSQAQILADDSVGNKHKSINVDKIFLDAYEQEVLAGGERYPSAQSAIVNRIQRGSLLLTYIGHGGELGWTLERVLEVNDITGFTNINKLPAFLTATCEFSRPDDPARTSAGELLLINPQGGGIALFTTTRLAYSAQNFTLSKFFTYHLFNIRESRIPTFGEVFQRTKASYNALNTRNFMLLGDPAVKFNFPRHQVITTSINGNTNTAISDTLQALSKVTVTGYIADEQGNKLTGFNGFITPTAFDKTGVFATQGNDPGQSFITNFKLQKNALYKGVASVTNGDFNFSFIVPKDIAIQYGYGKISYYAYDGTIDANGYNTNVIVGGVNANAPSDNKGPNLNLFMNDEKFVFGGSTDNSPILLAIANDSSGINTIGTGLGHDATAQLDNDNTKTYVLNDYYTADLNSYQSGKIRFPFSDLAPGNHSLKVKVWDVYNNSSEAYTEFVVAESAGLALNHVLNWPNPFTTNTRFMFEHNKPCVPLVAQVQIYTISGKLIKTIRENIQTTGFRDDSMTWDGLDDYGNKIGRGVYVYKLSVRTDDGESADKIEKLVILK
ncbi:MAG: hypothetical protein RIQ89_2200 [Bacteroidota bacterium]|jgi:hypothetical protein